MVCKEEWDADDNRWILCDLCDEPFHLQYIGLSMKKKIIDIDIESLFFECENCTDDL